jgi:hypothetical protein
MNANARMEFRRTAFVFIEFETEEVEMEKRATVVPI